MNNQATTETTWVDYFEFEGKTYKIYKRNQTEGASWYVHYKYRGERHLVSAETNIKKDAIKIFKGHIADTKAGRKENLEAFKSRRPEAAPAEFCTIGQLLKAYEAAPIEASDDTRHANANSLRVVVRRAHGGEDVDQLSTGIFNAERGPDLVRDYFEECQKMVNEARDQIKQQRIKRSANSTFNQAKGVFRPKAVVTLRRQGLVFPDTTWLETEWKQQKFGKVGSVHYSPPADDVVNTTFQEWAKLPRNEFLAVGHELAFGLRANEIAQATWGWWTMKMGQPSLDGECKVKAGSGRVEVCALDPFWRIMQNRIATENWRGAAADFVIDGCMSNRTQNVFRNVGEWLRSLGWRTQKTNHALRAYSGSQVAMKYGIYAAMVWLRHSSVKVTETHYTHFLQKHKIADPTKITAQWAQVTAPANVLPMAAGF